jgi:hypothetical protein
LPGGVSPKLEIATLNGKLARVVGRSYWFECSKCGYRAKVSGRGDRGRDCFVQTIVCRDCKQLYDAVIRVRVPDTSTPKPAISKGSSGAGYYSKPPPPNAPTLQAVLNRLPYQGVRRYKWLQYKAQCPFSANHNVQAWNDPDKCPRCGIFLEKNAVPYRIWE